jgi:hypothetical protein
VHRPRPGVRAVLGSVVDGDQHTGSGGGPAVRRGGQGAVPGPVAGVQLLSWATWGTSSSSSRWPASTR